jgi:hypothetical protein
MRSEGSIVGMVGSPMGWTAIKSWFDFQQTRFSSLQGVQTSYGGSLSLKEYWGFFSGDKAAGA